LYLTREIKENFFGLSFFLFEETRQVYIEVLESAYRSNSETFAKLVKILGEDLEELKRNHDYKRVMKEMWVNHILKLNQTHSSNATNFVPGQRLDWKREKSTTMYTRLELIAIILGISIGLRLSGSTPQMQNKIFAFLMSTVKNITTDLPFPFNLLSVLNQEELLNMAQTLSGERFEVTAGFGYFGYDIFQNYRRQNSGEISGIRFFKNISDSFAEIGFGVAGGFGGEVFGSSFASGIGTLAGGLGGGAASAFLIGTLTDRITQWIFNLPKDEALENAFRELKLPCNASNNEININFVCLAHRNPPPSADWVKRIEAINVIRRSKKTKS
jgi:hypothetical protein